MFKLPGDSSPLDRIQTFASYVLNCNSKGTRQSSSSLVQRKGTSYSNPEKKYIKNRMRPQTSNNKQISSTHHSRQSRDWSKLNFNDEVLISPSNRNFKYFVSEPHTNNIDCKLSNSNFLLQPCKIESIPIKPRKQLLKQQTFQGLKYYSPYGEKIKLSSQRASSSMLRNKSARQSNKSKPLKPQELIEPWQISDCFFESIKLTAKNP